MSKALVIFIIANPPTIPILNNFYSFLYPNNLRVEFLLRLLKAVDLLSTFHLYLHINLNYNNTEVSLWHESVNLQKKHCMK